MRPEYRFYASDAAIRALRESAKQHGAGKAELAAIERLHHGLGEMVDLERLEPLAKLALLPWREMFPEISPIPLCEYCNHKATSHAVDGEERRECMEPCCSCTQFEVFNG